MDHEGRKWYKKCHNFVYNWVPYIIAKHEITSPSHFSRRCVTTAGKIARVTVHFGRCAVLPLQHSTHYLTLNKKGKTRWVGEERGIKQESHNISSFHVSVSRFFTVMTKVIYLEHFLTGCNIFSPLSIPFRGH